jgi:LPS-assembly lipoprotein
MKEAILGFVIVTLILYLSACGFEPAYSTLKDSQKVAGQSSTTTRALLADIRIPTIPDREGQILRNALIDRFYIDGAPINPDFTLTVNRVNVLIRNLDITVSADTTRAELRTTTRYTLTDTKTGAAVLSNSITGLTSYNVLGSEFATRVSENAALENALRDMARQIELGIVLYLERKQDRTTQ